MVSSRGDVIDLGFKGSSQKFPRCVQNQFEVLERIHGTGFSAILNCLDTFINVMRVIKVVSLQEL
jgi:hypothetical protein